MCTQAMAWTCLMLAVHQAPDRDYFLNKRDLEINFHLKGAQGVRELNLLVSTDKGKTWVQGDKRRPEEGKFVYFAKEDGLYWFVNQVIDTAGKAKPDNPQRVRPNQILWVDTVAPNVQLTARRLSSGAIAARWTIQEQFPDTHSLHLEYHTGAMQNGQWTPLPAPLSVQGRTEFDPGQAGKSGPVQVRLRMKDLAGNEGMDEKSVPSTSNGTVTTAQPGEAAPIGVIPSTRGDAASSVAQLTSRQTPPSIAPSSSPALPAELSPLASTPPIAEPAAPFPTSSGAASLGLPKVQIVNKPLVRLDIVVAKVGPSGLGAADVYVTLNKGDSWIKMPKEAPIIVPAEATLSASASVRGSVSLELPAEATIYGFIVAAKSKAGLSLPPPQRGDPPQILVELDTHPPEAKLFKPSADPSQADTLVLSWNAVDRNLGDKPVTLEWAERKDGSWNRIGGPLPNSGRYPWHLPERMPSSVFLRLTVRDLAGNEARAQTDKPELIDLSVPQTKIIGLVPASR